MKLCKNETYTVDITDLNNLGCGVARIDNMVVFVPNTVDGDRVQIRIIKVTPRYCVGRLEEIEIPSPFRCDSPCSVSGRCGGCMYQSVDYAHELELKHRRVTAAFVKAGMPDVTVAPVLSTGRCNGYRNKIQLPVQDGSIGYYAPHSHRVVDGGTCPLHLPVFDPILDTLRTFLARYPADAKHIRHLFLRAGEGNPALPVAVCLVTDRALTRRDELCRMLSVHPNVRSVYENFNDADGNVILGDTYTLLHGDEVIWDHLCGMQFALSPASFYQVNHDGAELAYRKLAELAGSLAGKTLLDLYCGIGTIGIFLKQCTGAARLRGVEIVPQAVENARRNALQNGVENAEFFCGDAFLNHGELLSGADAVILDPPRRGCSDALTDSLCRSNIPRILYMSCSPETLARDAARLRAAGYRISEVTPVDLFPRTGHAEAVTVFTRDM